MRRCHKQRRLSFRADGKPLNDSPARSGRLSTFEVEHEVLWFSKRFFVRGMAFGSGAGRVCNHHGLQAGSALPRLYDDEKNHRSGRHQSDPGHHHGRRILRLCR
ncbi:hypothetical protein ALP20_01337 [Pseudomonas coronafaciens pv. coronafaciens]|nr:hypothetical protein ALP20_01337 [Pseudomonas coronafaciens pv. coronafaciens]